MLFDEGFWRGIINFDALVEAGMVKKADLAHFAFANTAKESWERLILQGLDIPSRR